MKPSFNTCKRRMVRNMSLRKPLCLQKLCCTLITVHFTVCKKHVGHFTVCKLVHHLSQSQQRCGMMMSMLMHCTAKKLLISMPLCMCKTFADAHCQPVILSCITGSLPVRYCQVMSLQILRTNPGLET